VFEINEDACDFLKNLPGPLGIISVAGMYRTGKSYLLNRMLLNRSGGFGVGPTINPCTKVFISPSLSFLFPYFHHFLFSIIFLLFTPSYFFL
jgi:hypothetical protein